ncbi:MAG: response regulator [Candidatus Thermoplasmatota archaeon]
MNKKIMVVDDEEDVLFTVGNMLEMEGYEVMKAADGEQALDMLENKDTPDLILLDIMMPGMDGWDVCAKIRENSDLSGIPIIFLTAKGDTMSVGMGGLGAEDYIVKPFNVKDLKERVEQVLKSKGK